MANETAERDFLANTQAVKRFLVTNGFNETIDEVLDAVSIWIVKRAWHENVVFTEEYAEEEDKQKSHAVRSKLTYHIKKNYQKLRGNMQTNYGFAMYEEYAGIKNFIEQMAIVVRVFCKDFCGRTP